LFFIAIPFLIILFFISIYKQVDKEEKLNARRVEWY
jgi:hypothetical protein